MVRGEAKPQIVSAANAILDRIGVGKHESQDVSIGGRWIDQMLAEMPEEEDGEIKELRANQDWEADR